MLSYRIFLLVHPLYLRIGTVW